MPRKKGLMVSLSLVLFYVIMPSYALSSKIFGVKYARDKLSRMKATAAEAAEADVTNHHKNHKNPLVYHPPIVYTIAGSDSGGGAGIQADLHAMHNMGCHGCSAVTCLTAQNSVGVTAVHAPPAAFLRQQLDALLSDLPPRAVKIGMLGTRELAEEVGAFLQRVKAQVGDATKVWVVLDPVMISTSGHRLIQEDAQHAMVEHLFPQADLLTPNKYEAEALLNRTLATAADVEDAARELLQMGVSAVLIKGGHAATDGPDADHKLAQDYFLSAAPPPVVTPGAEPRIGDGHPRGVWLRAPRFPAAHTHGTGCTLSSATAAALAIGEKERGKTPASERAGALSSVHLVDACCLAKAYVTAGIAEGVGFGEGPGPVAQTEFPASFQHFPSLVTSPFAPLGAASVVVSDDSTKEPFSMSPVYPIVDNEEWIDRICQLQGITDVQLRVKGESDPAKITAIVQACQSKCQAAGIRLWINDHWQAAVEAGCFGVHMGQEDLVRCIESGGLETLREKGVAWGISTHSFGELAAALGLQPDYISLGPIYATGSKKVEFDPQGPGIVHKWRQLIPPHIPFVVIGGINDPERAKEVREAGADSIAVIGAIVKSKNPQQATDALNEAMQR